MFKSARNKTFLTKLLDQLWPKTGFRRAFKYRLGRMARLQGSEHRIAVGFAAGAFASFTPFIGLHFIIAALVAFMLRGNILASAVGTVVGNPLTFPLIWLSTYQLGNLLLARDLIPNDSIALVTSNPISFGALEAAQFWNSAGPVLLTMLVGAVPLGAACALACYGATYTSLRKIRERPRKFARPRNIGASGTSTP